jgi:hypothetical protein
VILLARDCLLVRFDNGDTVPLRPEMIRIEVTGESASLFDAEFVNNVAAAVFHYFKYALGRDLVSLGEFSEALQGVLRGFALHQAAPGSGARSPLILDTDLRRLADETGGSELFFFPRLRDELRKCLRRSPGVMRFSGLCGCVKQLSGARRWSPRCQGLHEQIVEYLRGCLEADAHEQACSLVVE